MACHPVDVTGLLAAVRMLRSAQHDMACHPERVAFNHEHIGGEARRDAAELVL